MIKLSLNYCSSLFPGLLFSLLTSSLAIRQTSAAFPLSSTFNTPTQFKDAHLINGHGDQRRYFKEFDAISEQNEPYFLNKETNITAPLGGVAYLPCRIRQLGDRTVSWVRIGAHEEDLSILTFGNHTYTGDHRFRAMHLSENWTLQINELSLNDSGIYECQVPTESKLALRVFLNIVDVKINILEGSSLYLQKGAAINLTCTANYYAASSLIFWWHNGRLINFDAVSSDGRRGGVSVTAHVMDPDGSPWMMSRLVRSNALGADSGNYSCNLASSPNSKAAHVAVFVLNSGENPAAMQHGENGEGKTQELPAINNASRNNRRINVGQTSRRLFHGLFVAAPIVMWYKSLFIRR